MTIAEQLQSKKFTLSLSSGFFGFFAHTGFIQALEEKNIHPSKLTGSSAGALVAACKASGMTSQQMSDAFTNIKKSDFWDISFGLGVVRGDKMEQIFKQYMSPTFDSLKIPLQISAFDLFAFKTKTLSEGSVCKAVRASCAVPGLFHPVRINKRMYLDGGIADKLGLLGVLADESVVVHHLKDKSGFEFQSLNKKRFSNYLQFELKNITRSGPNHLHLGKEIISEAYQQTKAWLESSTMAHSETSKHNYNLTL